MRSSNRMAVWSDPKCGSETNSVVFLVLWVTPSFWGQFKNIFNEKSLKKSLERRASLKRLWFKSVTYFDSPTLQLQNHCGTFLVNIKRNSKSLITSLLHTSYSLKNAPAYRSFRNAVVTAQTDTPLLDATVESQLIWRNCRPSSRACVAGQPN